MIMQSGGLLFDVAQYVPIYLFHAGISMSKRPILAIFRNKLKGYTSDDTFCERVNNPM